MLDLLELIPLTTVFNMGLLIAYVAVVTRVTSYTVVLAAATLIEILHLSISTYLHRFFGIEEYAYLVFHLWYLFFAATDFLMVIVVILLCKRLDLRIQVSSKLVLGIFLFLGVLQVASYIERLYLNTELLEPIYMHGIPIINGAITAILFAQLLYELLRKRNQYDEERF